MRSAGGGIRGGFERRKSVMDAPDSLGNPVVHSLLVTLGNHAIYDARSYNWPCPVGHLARARRVIAMDHAGVFAELQTGWSAEFALKSLD